LTSHPELFDAAGSGAGSGRGNESHLLDSVKLALSETASASEQEKKLGEMIHQLEVLRKQMSREQMSREQMSRDACESRDLEKRHFAAKVSFVFSQFCLFEWYRRI
jgi:hypothetical protein